MTGSDRQYLWGQRHLALEKAEVSALYHQKRERFFELLDKYSKATSLLCGSAALWKIANPRVVEAMALAITFLSALSLVFSFSERSKRHAELARGFCLVAGDIVKLGRDFLDADVNRWNESLYKLDASEPPALGALVVLCQNEIALAKDQPDAVIPQNVCVRLLAHFFDMPRSH